MFNSTLGLILSKAVTNLNMYMIFKDDVKVYQILKDLKYIIDNMINDIEIKNNMKGGK